MAIRTLGRPKFLIQLNSIHNFNQEFLNRVFKQFSTDPKKALTSIPRKSHERNLISLSGLFRRYGFQPSQISNFLKSNQCLLNLKPSHVQKSLKILLSLKPSQEFLSSVVYSCPSILDFDFLEKWETKFSDMGISNFTSSAIRNIFEVSRRFELGPDDALRCVMCLKGLGFSESTVVNVLEAFPLVIMMDEDRIRDKMVFLMDIGFEKDDVDRIIRLFPFSMAFEVGKKMKPLFDEFEDLGFSLDVVRWEVLRDPRVLGMEVGELTQCLKMLRSLKCRTVIKENIFRIGAFRAGYEVKMRVDCLRKYGLTYRDAFTVLWKEPRALLYEIVHIEKKIDFLLQTMKFDVFCLVQVPEYLGVNFEKKVVPRYNVIEYLCSSGRLGDEVGLRGLIKPSRLRFYNLYVKPYPECKKLYGRYAAAEVKSRHPAGMWKLFQPQKHSESREDVENISSVDGSMWEALCLYHEDTSCHCRVCMREEFELLEK
ncbi:transcription termination factor MTERF15, mitochondrial isoform X4 [Coffea arabica]|uniref:Transcription termination factor MTERF15, mitochondrial isoform X4 n=1 Tax=Coffea arabica TaxID=13443 RepID=A0ABM4U4U5_COFAR